MKGHDHCKYRSKFKFAGFRCISYAVQTHYGHEIRPFLVFGVQPRFLCRRTRQPSCHACEQRCVRLNPRFSKEPRSVTSQSSLFFSTVLSMTKQHFSITFVARFTRTFASSTSSNRMLNLVLKSRTHLPVNR